VTGGSLQLRQFRVAIRDGVDVETAAEASGMSMGEARAWIADDLKNPPPPEAFILLTPAPVGHNSGETPVSDNIAVDKLRLILERIERLSEERKGLSADINDVFAEAASDGYDKAALKVILRQRAMDADKLRQLNDAVESYQLALGL